MIPMQIQLVSGRFLFINFSQAKHIVLIKTFPPRRSRLINDFKVFECLTLIKFFCYVSSYDIQLKEFLLELYHSQLQLGLRIGRKKMFIKIVSSSTLEPLLSLFSILLAISLTIEQFSYNFFGGQERRPN